MNPVSESSLCSLRWKRASPLQMLFGMHAANDQSQRRCMTCQPRQEMLLPRRTNVSGLLSLNSALCGNIFQRTVYKWCRQLRGYGTCYDDRQRACSTEVSYIFCNFRSNYTDYRFQRFSKARRNLVTHRCWVATWKPFKQS